MTNDWGPPAQLTALTTSVTRLQVSENPHRSAAEIADRLIAIAANVPSHTWISHEQLALPQQPAHFTFRSHPDVMPSDLQWAAETVGERAPDPSDNEPDGFDAWWVHELVLEDLVPEHPGKREQRAVTERLLPALREHGGLIAVTLRPCTPGELQQVAAAELLQPGAGAPTSPSTSTPPVAIRVLVATAIPMLSARVRAVLTTLPGSRVTCLGPIALESVRQQWDTPAPGARAVAGWAARAAIFAPAVDGTPVAGVDTIEPVAPQRPIRHLEGTDESILLGSGLGAGGDFRDVRLPVHDLLRGLSITGQTGTGKSTLLTTLAQNWIGTGRGLTLLDPHGTTVDRVLSHLDERQIERTLVMRFSDPDHVPPLNIWPAGASEATREVAISDLTELMYDIFDPRGNGIVGPRWERWFSLTLKGAVALLGDRASLGALPLLSRNAETMMRLANAIRSVDRETASALGHEFGSISGPDSKDIFGWVVSKFQRLLATPHLRQAFGRGGDAVDLVDHVDNGGILLVDLAMPTIGAPGARMLGAILLQRLWRAILERKERDEEHMVILDEAHLFQFGPLTSMLQEGRKFGLSSVVCHQHRRQLSDDMRHCVDGNAASTIAFRSSPLDAVEYSATFGTTLHDLPRLPALQALATLSVNGAPSAPFTLVSEHPTPQPIDRSSRAHARSYERLVRPSTNRRVIGLQEIQEALERGAPERPADLRPVSNAARERQAQVLAQLQAQRQAQASTPTLFT